MSVRQRLQKKLERKREENINRETFTFMQNQQQSIMEEYKDLMGENIKNLFTVKLGFGAEKQDKILKSKEMTVILFQLQKMILDIQNSRFSFKENNFDDKEIGGNTPLEILTLIIACCVVSSKPFYNCITWYIGFYDDNILHRSIKSLKFYFAQLGKLFEEDEQYKDLIIEWGWKKDDFGDPYFESILNNDKSGRRKITFMKQQERLINTFLQKNAGLLKVSVKNKEGILEDFLIPQELLCMN